MNEFKPEAENPKPETRHADGYAHLTDRSAINPKPVTLIEHRASQVVLQKKSVLFFATSDKKGALVYFLMGVLCFYASITLLVWRLSQGELHPPSIVSGVLVFVVGVFFQWRGVKRYRQTGAYLIDSQHQSIYSKDLQFQTSLNQVKKLFFSFDPLEIHRLNLFPEFPMWLTIELKSGKRIRVCKGRRVDLVPALNWLVAAGLPYTD